MHGTKKTVATTNSISFDMYALMFHFQPAERPSTTVGLQKPIYRGPRKYEPLGPGYKALWEVDRYLPRYQYSRHTMPDPQTTSLHSLQNPLERDKPIPCIRDQQKLIADYRNHACPDRTGNQNAYELQARSHVKHFHDNVTETRVWCPQKVEYDIKHLGVRAKIAMAGQMRTNEGETPANANDDTHYKGSYNPTATTIQTSVHKDISEMTKTVSWADQIPKEYNSGNSNVNNNNDECIDNSNEPRLAIPLDKGELPSLKHAHRDKLTASKGGRYYHYLNLNSRLCESDIPTNYNKLEDDITYRIVPDETTVSVNE